jgi:hypothetical protein
VCEKEQREQREQRGGERGLGRRTTSLVRNQRFKVPLTFLTNQLINKHMSTTIKKPKVFLMRSIQFAITTLDQLRNKYDIVVGPDTYSHNEMIEFLKDADAILLKGHFRMDKEVLILGARERDKTRKT